MHVGEDLILLINIANPNLTKISEAKMDKAPPKKILATQPVEENERTTALMAMIVDMSMSKIKQRRKLIDIYF